MNRAVSLLPFRGPDGPTQPSTGCGAPAPERAAQELLAEAGHVSCAWGPRGANGGREGAVSDPGGRRRERARAIMLASHQVQVQQPPGMSLLRKVRYREARTAPPTVPSPLSPAAGTDSARRFRLIAVPPFAHQARIPTDPLKQRRGLDGLLHGATTKRIGPGLSGEPRQVLPLESKRAPDCCSQSVTVIAQPFTHSCTSRTYPTVGASASCARDQGLTSRPRSPLPCVFR